MPTDIHPHLIEAHTPESRAESRQFAVGNVEESQAVLGRAGAAQWKDFRPGADRAQV